MAPSSCVAQSGAMSIASEPEALLHLLLSGASAASQRRLLQQHGSARAALAAGPRDWATHGLEPAVCHALRAPDRTRLARALDWLAAAPTHQLIGWADPDYPPLLRRIANPPPMLFVAGDPSLLWRPTLAIVGSRAATAGGRANAALFASTLARAGLCIGSGLAAGIDGAAHIATLEAGGATIAVLGTGPDVAYPAHHESLRAQIAQAGVVVSEHLPGTGPRRTQFPSRNRILAGLSLGVLVVEAAHRSGALITARLAAEAGREVFAIPGSIHNPMARGCHRLIRDGAQLVESPQEVLQSLAPMIRDLAHALRGALQLDAASVDGPAALADAGAAGGQIAAAALDDPAAAVQARVWQALGHDPTDMDTLADRTGLTVAELSPMLLAWELEGRVAKEYGRYVRIGS
ncbi:DNA processing protein [Thermomonas hydrothermalis]|uniref:DNA processing protein n=2 Tax=Thermomonas hydrothermalis TaxID=213588 RepID=A0A1M4ZXI5_9GAMM|nr:DNA processing protein [Thermomonas hydrothermalis]